jgi:hypothetical protein
LLGGAVVRLILIFFAGWFALASDALPEEVPVISRIGLAAVFLIASILVGEVGMLRVNIGAVLHGLKAVRTGATEEVADPLVAAATLIQGLRTNKDDLREKAHYHLKRITGQDLPPEAEAWEAWLKEQRAAEPGA